MAQDKATLLYFGDPMCSWCYGFSPELSKVLEQLGDQVDLDLVMGGLRPYGTETMADLDDFLKHHWEDVNERSGQPFKYEILKDKAFVYDTEPACRAVLVMRKLKPESEFEFFKAVQTAFYFENKNTSELATYTALAEKFGIESGVFQKEFESEEMKKLTRKDFETSAEMGVRGFPTLVLKKGDKLSLLCNGYAPAEQVIKSINSIINN